MCDQPCQIEITAQLRIIHNTLVDGLTHLSVPPSYDIYCVIIISLMVMQLLFMVCCVKLGYDIIRRPDRYRRLSDFVNVDLSRSANENVQQ